MESPPRAAHRRKITVEPAEAIRENGVGVKRAAVTPGEARVPEFNLKRIYKSPHRTLRNDTLHTNLQRPMAQ